MLRADRGVGIRLLASGPVADRRAVPVVADWAAHAEGRVLAVAVVLVDPGRDSGARDRALLLARVQPTGADRGVLVATRLPNRGDRSARALISSPRCRIVSAHFTRVHLEDRGRDPPARRKLETLLTGPLTDRGVPVPVTARP
jgi:hypothetical protein